MKNRKKIITAILVSVGVLCLATAAVFALHLGGVLQKDKVDVAWYEEEGKEFIITTAEELRGIAKLSEKHDFKGQTIKLGADIVLNEGDYTKWKNDFLKSVWTPIEGFAGTFDGQGHTISGLYCVANGFSVFGKDLLWNPAGMFVDSTDDAVIRDFRIVNSYYTSSNKGGLGSVIGRGNGTIESVYSSATLVASASINGGLVGEVKEGGSLTMKNCQFDGEMLLRGNNTVYTGGMIGYVKSTKGLVSIEHCLFSGEMISEQSEGTLDVGGFIGVTISKSRVEMVDCLSAGTMKTDWSRNIGSIIGWHTGNILKMQNVYADLSCYNATIGLAATAVNSYPLELVSDCFIGENALKWTELDFKKYWTVVEDGAPALRTFAETQKDASDAEKAYNTAWYDAKESTYTLNTLEDLYGFYVLSAQNAFESKTIKLGADIKVNEGTIADWKKEAPKTPWYPIKKFSGTFDGEGHTISGIYLQTAQRNSGLFTETTAEATLKDFKLTNSYFESVGDGIAIIGSIVGVADGTLDTIYSDAVVVADALIFGGIAGNVISTQRATITNCWYDGEMLVGDAGGYVGGIAGQVENGSHARILHCLNTANITATKEEGSMTMGGVVGVVSDERTKVTISDTLNVGVVSTPANSGIGSIVSTILPKTTVTMENCYATEESCSVAYSGKHGTLEGLAYRKKAADLSGYMAYEWTMLDFDKYWAVVKNGTPILQAFAEHVPSLAGHERKISIDWYKEKDKTYTLKTAADLYGFYHMSYMTDFEGKTVRLGKDITVNKGNAADWQNVVPSAPWYAIRNFAGTFDGQGHTISGIYMKTDIQGSGLFGSITPKTVIKNFRLTNSYFEGTHERASQIGSVVGKAQGKIESVYSNAVVVADTLIAGGIIGDISSKEKVVVSNCWYDGTMKIGEKGGYIGGITGEVQDGTVAEIIQCLNTGNIIGIKEKGSLTMGGIVGVIADDDTKVTISDTLNVGQVYTPSKIGIGAIVSTVLPKTTLILDNCYATEESCANYYASKHGTIEGSCYRKTAADLSGYMAYEWTLLNFDKYWAVVEDGTPVLKKFAATVPSVAGHERKINIGWYKQNAKEYVLKTANDLYGFYHMTYVTDFADKTVKLGADITVNQGSAADWQNAAPSAPWYAIRDFAGTFDGQGHTISGIYMKTDIQGSGLFGSITPKTVIKNFSLTNSFFEGTHERASQIGSVVGKAQGKIESVYSNAVVVADTLIAGGIIGDISSKEKVVVSNCWYDGTMKIGEKGGYIGGITGEVQDGTVAEIIHCLNTGNIIGTKEKGSLTMGGIVGVIADDDTKVTISDTLNVGQVYTPSKIGVGAICSTILPKTTLVLENCYATEESCAGVYASKHGTVKGACRRRAAADLSGYMAYEFTFLDFKNYWAVTEKDTPILKSFATKVPSLNGYSGKIDTSWYNENKDCYVLKTAEDLYGFYYLSYTTDFAGKSVKLGKDITVNDGEAAKWKDAPPAEPWYAIQRFAGMFDGQGHTISGVYLKTDIQGSGLFAETTSTAVIKDFKLKNSYFESTSIKPAMMGSVVGKGQGTFDTIYSDAIVVADTLIFGGIIGDISSKEKVVITNCWYDGDIQLGKNGGYVGGIAGEVQDGTQTEINNCLNTANITGSSVSGGMTIAGFVGVIADAESSVKISNSLNTGTIAPEKSPVGALVSTVLQDTTLTLDNCYATTESCANTVYKKHGTVNGACYQMSQTMISGNGGYRFTLLDFDEYWAVSNNSTPILQSFADNIPSVEGKRMDIAWYDEDDSEYTLTSVDELYGFTFLSSIIDFKDKVVKLGNDIEFTKGTTNNWEPIKSFAGTFDGNMHTISGLYLEATKNNAGLFSNTTGDSMVKNLKLKDCTFKSTAAYLGSVVGRLEGKLQNVYSDADVTSAYSGLGGLVGITAGTSCEIRQGWFAGTVTNTATGSESGDRRGTGGIVGLLYGTVTIENCLNTGTIDTTASSKSVPKTGGFVGSVEAGANLTATDCLNTGSVLVKDGTLGGYFVGCYAADMTWNTSYGYGNDRVVGYMNASGVKFTVNYILGGSSGTSERNSGNYWAVPIMVASASDLLGSAATTKLAGFDFVNAWSVNPAGSPLLKGFESEAYDTSWYDASKTEFVLKDEEDFIGFVVLSKEADIDGFSGKTIKLGTDIQINTGNAADWITKQPQYAWVGISTVEHPFKGTFDGDMHTISGVYINATTASSGLFNATASNSTIKNLKLTNSCVVATANYVGSVVGRLEGKLEKVYSEATMTGTHAGLGGLVGLTAGTSCEICQGWFAGTVTNTATGSESEDRRGTGGIVGLLYGTVTIENCLNTGTIDTTASSESVPKTGGFVGSVEAGANLTATDCLNTGSVLVKDGTLGGYFVGCYAANMTWNTSYGYGNDRVVGYMNASGIKFTVNYILGGSPGTSERNADNYWNVPVMVASASDILGSVATTKLAGFDFANVWKVVENGTPILNFDVSK